MPIISYLDPQFEINLWRSYLECMDGFLQGELEEKRTEFEAEKHKDLEGPISLEELISEEIFEIELFGKNLRNTAVIGIHSLFEGNIKSICRRLRELWGLDERLEDDERDWASLAQKVRDYLKEQHPATISDEVWNELERFNTIRNKIVHQDGKLLGGDPRLREYVKDRPDLYLEDPFERIVVSSGYLEHILDIMNDFFKELVYVSGHVYIWLRDQGLRSPNIF